MANPSVSVEDSFLTHVKRVRVDLQEKVARAHQLLQERETALLSELQQLEDTYKGEGVDKEIGQLRMAKEQNIATLTAINSQEHLQQIVTQLDSRIKNLKDNLDADRNRMRRVELQWDCNLESILGKIGSIQVGGDSFSCYSKEVVCDTTIRRSMVNEKVDIQAEVAKQGYDPFEAYKGEIKQERETKEGFWTAFSSYLQKIESW